MKLENAQAIVEWINANGGEARVIEGYSGRGMYGEETAAVRCDDAMDVGEAMGALGIKDRRRQDSLGLGMVVY